MLRSFAGLNGSTRRLAGAGPEPLWFHLERPYQSKTGKRRSSPAADRDGSPVAARGATDRVTAEELVRAGQAAPGAIAVELDAAVYALGMPTGSEPCSGLEAPHVARRPAGLTATSWTKSEDVGGGPQARSIAATVA
jgi:hypothetical protein